LRSGSLPQAGTLLLFGRALRFRDAAELREPGHVDGRWRLRSEPVSPAGPGRLLHSDDRRVHADDSDRVRDAEYLARGVDRLPDGRRQPLSSARSAGRGLLRCGRRLYHDSPGGLRFAEHLALDLDL
jgi:hypothetical protein